MHWHQVNHAAREIPGKHFLQLAYGTFNVVTDRFRRAGCNDRDNTNIRVALDKTVDSGFEALDAAEDCSFLVQ